MTLTLVVDFVRLVHVDDILFGQFRPVTTSELLISVWTEALVIQITYPFGCSKNHVGHVHTVGVRLLCHIDDSRRDVQMC